LKTLDELLAGDFHTVPELIAFHARTRGGHKALVQDDDSLTYLELDAVMDRVAAALQRDGVESGDTIAICATTSINYMLVFLGALRAGVAAAPLAPSSTPESLAMMVEDCGAKLFFLDAGVAADMTAVLGGVKAPRIALDGSDEGAPFDDWMAAEGSQPRPVEIDPDQAFNIIYSSGTTGAPKGIVQPHIMRWYHSRRMSFGHEAVTLVSTPLYSNTTLVSVFPTLTQGGTLVLMAKSDIPKFLELAEKHRVTHAMLVPVQYRRFMDYPDFDKFDLSSFRQKFSTSAPFPAELKAQVLKRWPGGLTEIFGMTEGGVSCVLDAHLYPHKLHTVGQPSVICDIKLIDENGVEVAQGEVGEVVGHSLAMMSHYHNLPEKTVEAEWIAPDGRRYIRSGDVARYDEDGFLVLMDRKKDMIISGGFNIYPSDLEAVVIQHPAVTDVAVVGVESRDWGETPVGFVALKPGMEAAAEDIRQWANAKLGKTQRLADLIILESLPRSHIGKVLKRDLRDGYKGAARS